MSHTHTDVPQFTLNELKTMTLKWSQDRKITINGRAETQALKLVSEIGELADNLIKGKSIKDDIGDALVVLTNLSALEGLTLEECWSHAWNDIKDRKGVTLPNGNFIKSTDPVYIQMEKEGKL